MVLGEELLDTFVPCSYNPSDYRINLRNNVMCKKPSHAHEC